MKKTIIPLRTLPVIATALLILSSCQKNDLGNSQQDTTSTAIAVPASLSSISGAASGSGVTDSVYVMQNCGRGGHRDSVAATTLPATIETYLSANYAGYTFNKAFAIKNSTGTLTGYVTIIYFNDKPVGVEFDSAGNFVRVLEQREKGDLEGDGHHRGGRFEHRDGQQRDTIALVALDASITSYFSANYPADTLVKAFRNRDSSIVVLSRNNGIYVTVFNATGGFVQRSTVEHTRGKCQSIELSQLPSAAAAYLAQTYPNYVFDKAFSLTENGTVKGYVVIIDANNTKYAVEFDASGTFVRAITIH